MSITYTPTTNFAGKDSLPSNDSNKVVKGAEFTTEFTAIQSAFALAAPSSNPTYTGTATFDDMNVGGDLNVTGSFTSPGIDDNANATAITIDASENVGIGTTSPVFRLSAESASATVADLKSTSANSNLRLTNSGGLAVVSSEANDLVFSSSTSEKMRINTTGNVGIGTSDPSAGTSSYYDDLVIKNATSGSGAGITIQSNSTNGFGGLDFRKADGTQVGKVFADSSTGNLGIETGGVSRVNVTDIGNIGIGTANPLNKLVVSEGTGQHGIEFAPGTLSYMQAYDRATSDYGDLRIDAQTITFGTDIGAERMRIDAVGNVGIGTTTPNSADNYYDGWGLSLGADRTFIGTTQGGDSILGGASGSAYTAITAGGTEAMRINGAGNVGVGTSNPDLSLGTGLHVKGVDYVGLTIQKGGAGFGHALDFTDENNALQYRIGTNFSSGGQNLLFSYGTNVGMMMDSSGNIGIGETNPNFKLDVTGSSASSITDVATFTNPINAAGTGHGARLLLHSTQDPSRGVAIASSSASNYAADNDMLFYTSVSSTLTERMRIDAVGNLLVGKTSTTAADSGVVVADISDAIGQVAITKSYSGTTSAMKFYYGLTQVGRIDYSDTTTDYITSSDIRLKDNIVDAPAGNIDSIKVRSFDWKIDGEHQEYGFIAQELETVAPYAVSKGETDEDTWGVDYSKLVPMLVKEIQDLKAKVEALENA